MSSATGGGSSSIFSDHPTDATRIQQIQGWLPEAKKYYKPTASVSSKSSVKSSGKTIKISSKKNKKK
jgi:hypothetical protein